MRTCQIGVVGFRGDGSDELLEPFVVDIAGCPFGDLVSGEAGGGVAVSVWTNVSERRMHLLATELHDVL